MSPLKKRELATMLMRRFIAFCLSGRIRNFGGRRTALPGRLAILTARKGRLTISSPSRDPGGRRGGIQKQADEPLGGSGVREDCVTERGKWQTAKHRGLDDSHHFAG